MFFEGDCGLGHRIECPESNLIKLGKAFSGEGLSQHLVYVLSVLSAVAL
jgi:hypothetical protein